MQRLVAAAMAAVMISAVTGCGGESESQLLASARTYLEKKDDKAAILQLKSALQKNPQSGEARYLLGRALLHSGDAAAAAVELEKAGELKFSADEVAPTLAEAWLTTGNAKKVTDSYASATLTNSKAAADLQATVASAFIAQGLVARCQEAVNAALQSDPKNVVARLLQARLTAGRGAYDQALSLVDSVIADDPKRPQAWQLKGELLWIAKSDIDGGIKAYREALAAEPRFLPGQLTLIRLYQTKGDAANFRTQVAELSKAFPKHPEARFYQAQLALIDGDFKRARDGAQELLRVAPDNPLLLQLAGAIEFQGGAPMVAENYLNRAIQISPKLPLARRLLAESYLRVGEPGKALAVLQPLLEQAKPGPEVLALTAESYLQSGDLAKAESYFTRAAKVNPEDPKVRTALALTQIAKGNSEAGFGQLETLAATDPGIYADLALVSARLQRNDPDAALKAVERLRGKISDKPLPYLLQGRILAMRKDSVGARASFDKALALDPVYFPAVADLAALDMAEKRPEAALKHFEALLAKQPKNYRALLAVADLRQRAGAKPEEIGALLADAVKLNPGEATPRLLLVEHSLARRNAKAALAAAQDGVAALPDNPQLMDALGRAQLAAGDTQQAISTFSKLASAQPTLPQPHLRLADAYAIGKDYPAAAKSLRRALDISPNLLLAQRGLVRIALAEKRVDDAIAVARSVQKQRPTEAVGYVMEGEVHLSQRAWDPAIGSFRSALERGRNSEMAKRLHALYVAAGRAADAERFAASWLHEQPRDADFLFHLGSIAMDRKDYAAAEGRYRQALALLPDNAATLNNIAWLLVQQGRPGAVPMAERATQLMPEQVSFLDTLATALAADKQMGKAVEAQQKAVAAAPEQAEYRLNLAKLLIQAGERAKARAELDKLAALGAKYPNQGEVATLLKGL